MTIGETKLPNKIPNLNQILFNGVRIFEFNNPKINQEFREYFIKNYSKFSNEYKNKILKNFFNQSKVF